jgi:fatty-acyl-CoA synthase
VLTHANLWWHNIGVVLALDIAYEDVSLVCAPMFDIGALNVTTIATWIKGGGLVIHRAFEPQAVLDDLQRERVTTMFGVPVMCEALSALPGFEAADLSRLRLIITGGAPVAVGPIRLFQQRQLELVQGYGLTEASPVASFRTAEDALRKIGSAGRSVLLCDPRGCRCHRCAGSARGGRGDRGAGPERDPWLLRGAGGDGAGVQRPVATDR